MKLQTKRERRERESLRFAESIWQVFEWMCAAGSGERSLLPGIEPGVFGVLDVAGPMGPSFGFCELQLVDSSLLLFHSKSTCVECSHRIKSDRDRGVHDALLAMSGDTLLHMRRASCRAIS